MLQEIEVEIFKGLTKPKILIESAESVCIEFPNPLEIGSVLS